MRCMSISRRELLGGTAAGLLATTTLGRAQSQAADPTEIQKVKDKLRNPLPDKADDLLKTALAGNKSAAAARWRHQLPENSEPCFLYLVTGAKERKR